MSTPSPNSTDAALVAAFQAGDRRAFELLVERHQGALVRYAAGRLGVVDAEDVVQDALLRAHRALSEGKTPTDPKAWLYVIVRNVCIDAARAQSRRPTSELQDDAGEPRADPADLLIGRQRFAEVVSAIHALPPRQRDALVDVELGDRSYEDVASATASSPSAVKALVSRARVAVRNAAAAAVAMPPLAIDRLRGMFAWLRDAPELLSGAILGKASIAAVSAVSAVAVVASVPHQQTPVPEQGGALALSAPGHDASRGAPASQLTPTGGASHLRSVSAGGSATHAGASASAMSALRDCASGRPLGHRYTADALRRARHDMGTDIAEYTSCDDDLRLAMLHAGRSA